MVAHPSQLIDVPADFSDEAAVLIEPTACAAHAAARYTGNETVIIGAGTLGLLTLAAITATRDKVRSAPIVVTARYAEQKRLAKELGADVVCSTDEMPRYVRSSTNSLVFGDQLTCVFVNNGLLRSNEADTVQRVFGDNFRVKLKYVNASARFLKKLRGITAPERKRKIIGNEFVRVFEDAVAALTKAEGRKPKAGGAPSTFGRASC